jgi:hypothetical protein
MAQGIDSEFRTETKKTPQNGLGAVAQACNLSYLGGEQVSRVKSY